MTCFRGVFIKWFVFGLLSFLLANTSGAIRPMGLLPFRSIGFPQPFWAWGTAVDTSFEFKAFMFDLAIGIMFSLFLGVFGIVVKKFAGFQSK